MLNKFTSRALVDEMRERNSTMSKAEGESAVARVFDAIDAIAQRGDTIRVASFGTFKMKTRAGGTVKSPRTGETVTYGESKSIGFKPYKPAK